MPEHPRSTAAADRRLVFGELRAALIVLFFGVAYMVTLLLAVMRFVPEASTLGAGTGLFAGVLAGGYLVLLLGSIARVWSTDRKAVLEVAQLVIGIPTIAVGGGGLMGLLSSDLPAELLSSYVVTLALIAGPLSLPFFVFLSYRAGVELLRA